MEKPQDKKKKKKKKDRKPWESKKKDKEKEKGKEKETEGKGPKKDSTCPPDQGVAIEDPYVTQLLTQDPKQLVDYEPNLIDLRIESGEGYTPGGAVVYMDPNLVPVEVFEPGSVPLDSSWCIFGRRRSGKSYFTRDMFYAYHESLDHGLIMTKTKHNHFFQVVPPQTVPKKYKADYQGGFIPDGAVIQGFDPFIVSKFLEFQLDFIKHEEEYNRKGWKLPGFLWLDDVVDAKVIMTEGDHGILAQLFQQGRHFDVMVGINTQYPRSVPTKMRDNVDYAVVFKQDSNQEFEAIIDHYMGELNRRTARELVTMYTRGTFNGPKQCLVINMQSGCPWEEKYKTYVANPEPPTFVVGGKKYQDRMKYTPDYEVSLPKEMI